MMLVSLGPNEPVSLPPHPDGPGGWAYAVVDDEGQVIFADNAGELVALVILGYGDISDSDEGHDEALATRYEALVEMAERAQRYLVDQAAESGLFDPLEADEETLTALFAPRTRPWEGHAAAPPTGIGPTGTGPIGTGPVRPSLTGTGPTASRPPGDHVWRDRVPLVLIATDYEPYTDRPKPTGRALFLDPSTEISFLRSLDALGLIKLLAAGPAAI